MPKRSAPAGYKRFQRIGHNFFRSGKRVKTGVAGGNLILVLDDDEMVRRCLVRLIRGRGFMVKAYSSAEEFLSAKQSDHPLCLLLDVTLIGMSGLELQRRLVDERRNLPIIFMAANDEPGVRAQALRGGAISFLLKPFNEEALWSAVESLSIAPGERPSGDGHVEVTTRGGHHASRKMEWAKKRW
jgi:FixJ family two-component response regulator